MEENTERHLANAAIVAALVATGLLGWAAWRVHKAYQPAAEVPVPVLTEMAPTPAPTVQLTPIPVTPAPVVQAPQPLPAPTVAVTPRPRRAPAQPAQPSAGAAVDPRVALEGVGKDAAAEQIWVAAINDTTVAAGDRKNLIEDLNETGFADPRNLTPDDLPVIENRIALIEQLYPSAVDDTNVAAFDEAYKDLLAMRARLTGQ